jgi:hypothetical protein
VNVQADKFMILSNSYVLKKDKNAEEEKFLIKLLLNVFVLSIYLIGMVLDALIALLVQNMINLQTHVLK